MGMYTLLLTPISHAHYCHSSKSDVSNNVLTHQEHPEEDDYEEVQLLINSLNELFLISGLKDDAQQIINHYSKKLTTSLTGFVCESLLNLNTRDIRKWIASHGNYKENINLVKDIIKVAYEDIAALN